MNTDDSVRELGDGLVLRRATLADVEKVAEFNARVHSDVGWDTLDMRVDMWVRDLMTRPHLTFSTGDFLAVEDVATGAVVSSTNLISQTWSYAGVEFGVGRPELVGTHPDYRKRGLVRAQFEVLHRWSAERGHRMQAITGIPNYYRQFGYEMAVDLHGGPSGPLTSVPQLKEGTAETYAVRPAEPSDVAFIVEVQVYAGKRHVLSCARDAAMWRYELDGRTPGGASALRLCIIEQADGEPVGFLAHPEFLWGDSLALWTYELKPGASWWEVTPCVMRYLEAKGAEYPPYIESENQKSFERLVFVLGSEHPCYEIVSEWLPRMRKPYSWYVRVPDLPGFLQHIAPVLEARLARSVMVGYSGELKLNFYHDGVKMAFEKGCIADVVPWESPVGDAKSAEFPNLTFLQLLFGYRSFAELEAAYTDCGARHEMRLLLNALFPKQVSAVWPVS